MAECSQNCAGCSETCNERKEDPKSFLEKPNENSQIHKVIGIVSGKGGVGKSLVTSLSAVMMNRRGYKTAILDADITGPSIPKSFGIHERAQVNELGLLPVQTNNGMKIMSINLLLENETDPVIWRGPIIASAVKQFWTDVAWGEIDYMFVDLPPGTGDVPLTVFQSIPLDGIVVVTSPQELVSLIVKKAVKMAKNMNIPIYGIVENMSYVKCPDCDCEIKIFGESNLEKIAQENNLDVLGKIPIDSRLAALSDQGKIEESDSNYLEQLANAILSK